MKEDRDIDALLKELGAYQRQKVAEEYAKAFFNPTETYIEHCDEEMQKEMELVNCIVQSFFPSDFATLIHLHYINNITLEKCAECMHISRSTVCRLLKRAHVAVNNRYQKMKGAEYENLQ